VGLLPEYLKHRFGHAVEFGEDLAIGESEDAEPLSSQDLLAPMVTLSLIRVVGAIHLYHHHLFKTGEVGDEGRDRMLPPELVVGELPTAQ